MGIHAANYFIYLGLVFTQFALVGSLLALSLDANPCSLPRQNRRSRSNPALRQKYAQCAYAVPGKNWSSFGKAGIVCWQIQRPPYSKPRNGLPRGGGHLPVTRNCSVWSSLTRKAVHLALLLFIVSKALFSGVRSPLCVCLARDREILTRSISLRCRAAKRSAPMHSWHGSANKKTGTSVPWRRFRKIRSWQSGLVYACRKPNGTLRPR